MRPERLACAAAIAALMLSACSQEKTPEAMPSDAAATASPSAEASATATPLAVAQAIPQSLQGRWGLVPADCTSTRGDAKGLMTIGAQELTFYESRARLGTMKDGGADSILGSFAFTGEGQEWALDVSLETRDGGKTLIRRDNGTDAIPAPLTYTRC